MRERLVSVEAEDRAAALLQAAAKLQTDPGNISLQTVTARTYRAALQDADDEVTVEVSPDGLEARIASYARALGAGRSLSPESLERALTEAGVTAPADAEAVERLFVRLRKGLDIAGIVIARGTPPQHGTDGRFELTCTEEPSTPSPHRDAKLDFYERETVPSVEAGGLIGSIVPAQEGTPGQTVRGEAIPARKGKAVRIGAGRSVEASEDGSQFRAKVSGVVQLADSVLSVAQAFEIRRDVDFVMGDVRVRHASVVVRGSVRSGRSVACGGDLEVRDTVENAQVEAGGNVRVTRGIAMRDGGHVKAGGSVSAHFAENATVVAGGDVVIENDLTNCDIQAHGRVLATKAKGRIQGGSVRSGQGVEANEIGSPLGVPTEVVVGLRSDAYAALAAEEKGLLETLRKVTTLLGVGEPTSILQRLPVSKRGPAAELLKTAAAARKRLDIIEPILKAQDESLRRSCSAGIKVRGTVYPGVALTIAGRSFDVREPMAAGWFRYDSASDSVVFEPLRSVRGRLRTTS